MAEVCSVVSKLGYQGLEIAPFTLAPSATEVTTAQRADARKAMADCGLECVGLHWLFAGPEGLHMTTPDDATWQRTRDYLSALLDLCADLGGKVLVLGSPKQRSVLENQTPEGAWQRAAELLGSVLDKAGGLGLTTPVPEIIRSVTDDDIGHFHVNDANLYGPGMGDVDYAPIAEAIRDVGYDRWLSVEVFKYDPDPETIARKSIEYLRQFWS